MIIISFNSYSQVIDNGLDLNNLKVEIKPEKIISKMVELDKVVYGFGPVGNSSYKSSWHASSRDKRSRCF